MSHYDSGGIPRSVVRATWVDELGEANGRAWYYDRVRGHVFPAVTGRSQVSVGRQPGRLTHAQAQALSYSEQRLYAPDVLSQTQLLRYVLKKTVGDINRPSVWASRPQDLEALRNLVPRLPALVGLTINLGGGIKRSHVIRRLEQIREETGAAVTACLHLNSSQAREVTEIEQEFVPVLHLRDQDDLPGGWDRQLILAPHSWLLARWRTLVRGKTDLIHVACEQSAPAIALRLILGAPDSRASLSALIRSASPYAELYDYCLRTMIAINSIEVSP